MDKAPETSAGKCPVMHTSFGGRSNRDWWPNQLNLKVLHQHPPAGDPLGASFDYARPSGYSTCGVALPWMTVPRFRVALPT